jgi:hypothetical protein
MTSLNDFGERGRTDKQSWTREVFSYAECKRPEPVER